MWFQSNTMFFNVASRKTTKLETNKCRPYVVNKICEMLTFDYEHRHAQEAQCNTIGRKIGFNGGSVCDSASQIVYIPATQPLAPRILKTSYKM